MSQTKPTYEELAARVSELESSLRRSARASLSAFHQTLDSMQLDESTLLDIVRLNPYAMAIFNSEGRYIEGNAAYHKLFPETPVPEYSLFEDKVLLHLGFAGKLESLKRGCVAVFPELDYNPRNMNPDWPDIQTYMKVVSFPIMDKAGVLDKVICMYEDVTDQKNTERALRESQDKFQAFYRQSIYAVGTLDDQGNFLEVNQKSLDITGYAAGELLGMNIAGLVIPEQADRARAVLVHAAERPFEKPGEFTVRCRGGALRHVQANVVPLTHGGHSAGFQFTALDVTESRRAQDEIHRLNQFLSVAIDSANVWVDVLDTDANVVLWNQAAEQICGYTRDEVLGNARIWEWLYPDPAYRDFITRKAADIIQAGRPVENFETTIRTKSGEARIISWNSRNLLDETGAPMGSIALGRDVTRMRRAVKEREILSEQLVQSQKMEAVGRLAGGMAHEFNNILAVILGNSDIILKYMDPLDPNFARVEKTVKVALRARDLTLQLLTFARKDKLNVAPVSPNTLVRETMDMLDRAALHGTALRTDLAPDIGLVDADANQIVQALLNLCLNACDAMSSGGELLIRTRTATLGPSDARLKPPMEPGVYAALEVLDTGSGIPEKIRDRICEPFFTTKARGQGTGLGLSVTLGIIRNHNGILHVTPRPGRGTRASIYLPLAAAPQAPAAPAPAAPHAAPAPGQTVLLVDDNPDILSMLHDIFAMRGDNVLCAASGPEALELFHNRRDSISLVILDIVMPGMDGGEVFTRIKQDKPDATIIVCSGYSMEGMAEDLLARGAAAFLQKPFEISELDAALAHAQKR